MLTSILTEPTVEPVSLFEVKEHLNLDHDEDDRQIEIFIRAARQHVESRCNRVIVRQKWRLYLDDGFRAFHLRPTKVQEVEQIQYLDTDGATQTLSTSVYTADIPRQAVYLAYSQSWPSTRTVGNAVWADVWSGYYKTSNSPIQIKEDIPDDIRAAMLLLIEDLYEHRGKNSEIVLRENPTFNALVQSHIVYENR